MHTAWHSGHSNEFDWNDWFRFHIHVKSNRLPHRFILMAYRAIVLEQIVTTIRNDRWVYGNHSIVLCMCTVLCSTWSSMTITYSDRIVYIFHVHLRIELFCRFEKVWSTWTKREKGRTKAQDHGLFIQLSAPSTELKFPPFLLHINE